MPNFRVTATPVQVEQHDGYSTVRFELFAQRNQVGEVFIPSPAATGEVLAQWASTLTLPTTTVRGEPSKVNAWTVSILKPARWPQGFKTVGERSLTFTAAELHPVPQDVLDALDRVDANLATLSAMLDGDK